MYAIDIHHETISLHSPTHRAEIYLYGGLLNRLEIQQANGDWFNAIVAFNSPDDARSNLINGFHSAKLSPYACRLQDGDYLFAGQAHHCSKHQFQGHAIHGLMYDAIFSLEQSDFNQENAWIIISANYAQDDDGFPFNYQLKIKYLLNKQGLTIQTQAINTGKQALPLMDGWHPYFTLGGTVDDWTLYLNSNQILEFNDGLLPTGHVFTDHRFQAGTCLQNIQLDNSFILNNHEQVACVLHNHALKLSIFAEPTYPYLQIYIPSERDAIAIENLSGAPNAFNNGMGLVVLDSGQTATFTTRYLLQNLSPA